MFFFCGKITVPTTNCLDWNKIRFFVVITEANRVFVYGLFVPTVALWPLKVGGHFIISLGSSKETVSLASSFYCSASLWLFCFVGLYVIVPKNFIRNLNWNSCSGWSDWVEGNLIFAWTGNLTWLKLSFPIFWSDAGWPDLELKDQNKYLGSTSTSFHSGFRRVDVSRFALFPPYVTDLSQYFP